jgi:hypothetical protein
MYNDTLCPKMSLQHITFIFLTPPPPPKKESYFFVAVCGGFMTSKFPVSCWVYCLSWLLLHVPCIFNSLLCFWNKFPVWFLLNVGEKCGLETINFWNPCIFGVWFIKRYNSQVFLMLCISQEEVQYLLCCSDLVISSHHTQRKKHNVNAVSYCLSSISKEFGGGKIYCKDL